MQAQYTKWCVCTAYMYTIYQYPFSLDKVETIDIQ